MKLRIGSDGFALAPELVADVVSIVGRRGRGKTTTAVVLVEELAGAGVRFCVADPVGVWHGLKSSRDGKAAGLSCIVMGGDHGDVPLEETAGKVIADFVADPESPSVILDFLHFRKGQLTRFMTDFLEELYHRNRAALHLVLDEADKFAPQRVMGEVARLVGAAEDIVKMGRARGILPVLITQRPAALNKNVLSQTGLLIAHALTGPHDRKAIDEWIRENAEEGQREKFIATIAGLPRGTAWFWQPEAELFRQVAVRDRRTFDSSATPASGREKPAPKVVAEVDLEALKKRIASTIEKAKASDPKELQKQIAELKRELAVKPAPATPKVERVEVPVLPAQMRADLQIAMSNLERAIEPLTRTLAEVAAAIATVGKNGHRDSSPGRAWGVGPRSPQPRLSGPDQKRATQPSPARESTGELGRGERTVLTAIAQHPAGVTREQLTVLTGYKRSTRDLYLQKLGAGGFISREGAGIVATDAGVSALGDDFDPLPTGDELRAYWLSKLPQGERTVLEALIERYPYSVHRQDLDVGYQRSTRDLYLQKLASRKLVESPGPGLVRASEELFG
jgi:hypothetical protein